MRFKSSWRNLANLPALLAGLVIVFWPAFASVVCCCQHETVAMAVQEMAPPACPHCAAANDTKESCASESDGCHCGIGCRSHFAGVLPSLSQASEEAPVSLAPVLDLWQFPRGTSLASETLDAQELPFLLAQDHCAQICCWLK